MAIEKRRAVKAMEDEVNEWMTHMREKISVTALDQLNHPLAYEQLPRVDDIVRPPQCSFNLPPLQTRLEKLMGSNVVRLTDRNYMLSLRKKIQEEYEETVRKRIQSREQAEIDRQKKLILDGKMPFSDAPSELTNHPVFKITQITHQMLDEKKYKAKRCKKSAPNNHDHKASPGGQQNPQHLCLDASGGRASSQSGDPSQSSARTDGDNTVQAGDTGEQEYVFTQEQFDRLRYETQSVKYLRGLETVQEIYETANLIVGELQLHNVEKEPVVGCTTLGINIP
ncbi:hypothetical protein M8J75_007969 [Diaphorina citri]|nr:hypothetical protein M8J75_007969 [Diaphorina citri]